MLAALQMQYLATLTSTHQIKQALPVLSKRFEDYHKQSLDRIREKAIQHRVFLPFTWLLFASAPLGVEDLAQCLCIEFDTELETSPDDLDEYVERLAAESEGLVNIGPTASNDAARPPHTSDGIYLRSSRSTVNGLCQSRIKPLRLISGTNTKSGTLNTKMPNASSSRGVPLT